MKRKYKVSYINKLGEKAKKKVKADGLYDLLQKLDTKYLYHSEFESIYKIVFKEKKRGIKITKI
jgi:hypothetical protein